MNSLQGVITVLKTHKKAILWISTMFSNVSVTEKKYLCTFKKKNALKGARNLSVL